VSASAVASEGARPANATMRCKDGTYLSGAPSTDRCSGNGGTAVTYPTQPPTPTAPARRP
jgi:hypothetical protein